jgi:hypothetical protein
VPVGEVVAVGVKMKSSLNSSVSAMPTIGRNPPIGTPVAPARSAPTAATNAQTTTPTQLRR